MGLGVDIVYLNRIKDPLRLAKGVLTNAEYEEYLLRKNSLTYLAGRYAAKEAFLKANHVGLGAINFKDIEILNEANGAPYLTYQNKRYEVSISHDGDYAIAVVMI